MIEVPYELTVGGEFREFWHSAFYCHDRINTSTPFARKLGLQDQVLPFSLMLFLTGSMSHADAAKVQVGFHNAVYHWPGFAGDTFTKKFKVRSVRNTSAGDTSVITFNCELINQRGRVVMSTDKTMMFPFKSNTPSTVDAPSNAAEYGRAFQEHLMSKAEVLGELGSHSLRALRPHQLIIHTMNRALSLSQSQGLSSLARLTHERHFDSLKFKPATEMFVPGGLVLGLAMSSSARDLHEILHEELLNVNYTNHVHPGETVMALTYVQAMDENISGDLESLVVTTLGVKNIAAEEFNGLAVPTELFTNTELTTKMIEAICKEKCPALCGKIVVQAERKIIRQASRSEAFLL
jgi:acyl dehydratase